MSFNSISSSSSPKSSKTNGHSNLMSFLHSVTPNVPANILPKSFLQDLNNSSLPVDGGAIEYYTLQDFWESYEEWSAFGVGIPMLLNNGAEIVQYFTPSLSAVQIFTIKPLLDVGSSQGSISDSEVQSSSEESDSEKLSRSSSNNSNQNWDAKSTDSSSDPEGMSSPVVKDRLGHLYFQFSERSSPFMRTPLLEKICELSETYPGICDLKSIDLSPASWMSLAWYPIYHIPMKGSLKDLTTCFLTYHTLSSFVQGDADAEFTENHMLFANGNVEQLGEGLVRNREHRVSVPPFGLASYRMQGDVWLNGGDSCDFEKIIDLYNAADSWLKQVEFSHPDFGFFTSHSPMSLSLA